MREIRAEEVLDLVAYERARGSMLARIIQLKARRRISLGDNLTLLFENRDTVLFQIQEMVRTERIVKEEAIAQEVETYNALIPGPGELSATLFIEIPDIAHMSQEDVRRAVNRFQGLDRHVGLRVGPHQVAARFEEGRSTEQKMSAVHFLRFAVGAAVAKALADGAASRLFVAHPEYRAEAELPVPLREEALADLS